MTKKLYKSDTNKVFSGVIGGIGEYFDIDPTILRLGYILITVMTNIVPGIIGYIIASLVVPKKPIVHHVHHTEHVEHTPKSE